MSARQMLSRPSLFKLPWDVDVAEEGVNVKLWSLRKLKNLLSAAPTPNLMPKH